MSNNGGSKAMPDVTSQTVEPSSSSSAAAVSKENGSMSTTTTNNNSRAGYSALRWLVIDIPLMVLFAILVLSAVIQHLYLGYVMTIVDYYRRGPMDQDGFYPELHNDFTYYNRQCDATDITTTKSSADMVIGKDFTAKQAADVMLEHGAVLFTDVLTNQTASDLRVYLESRHKIQPTLGWNEKFYEEGQEGAGRLALGIGVRDHPAVTEALKEIGTHAVVKRTLEELLGPDPAVVEISTMTSMHGADDQGIHTDSDYFGSSLLYSRNFLHSYSFFVSLQDTTSHMGATTVCPGSHNCANADLDEVCLENGAFEVSTNGYTGDKGMLRKGDALLFNQNVWHRGAANYDEDHRMNRVMFILTFASRTKETVADRRQLGLGTYYYQRWNMWGHTFNDLKDAATIMVQPLGALRALGLAKIKGRKWGVTWIEQFARQLANSVDFYDDYVFKEFIQELDSIGFPMFLRGTWDKWKFGGKFERFIRETFEKWVAFVAKVNAVVLGVYVGLRLLLWLLLGVLRRNTAMKATTKRQWIPSFLKRLVLTHGAVALLGYALLRFVDQTELAQYANSREIFIRPYSTAADANRPSLEGSRVGSTRAALGPTTFPERNDVLISTRFDTPFLGSFNRMLDFHPGNMRFNAMVASFATLPPAVQDQAFRTIVKSIHEREAGVAGRFLMQDPTNGCWTLVSDRDALKETRRAVMMEQSGLVDGLGKHLSSILADSRFGVMRDTILSRRFTPLFVKKWENVVFAKADASGSGFCRLQEPKRPKSKATGLLMRRPFVVTKPPLLSQRLVKAETRQKYFAERDIRRSDALDEHVLQVGDQVLGNYEDYGRWLQGRITRIFGDGTCRVEYSFDDYETLSADDIRMYESLVEGDKVEAEFGGFTDNWISATIAKVHPLGTYDINYDNGDKKFHVKRTHIRKSVAPPVSLGRAGPEDDDEVDEFVVGTKIEGNFNSENEWFAGRVTRVNDDGTFNVLYDDGDRENRVAPHLIRKY